MSDTCIRCGKRAAGYATINDDRLCHEGKSPTCYELQSWEDSGADHFMADLTAAIQASSPIHYPVRDHDAPDAG